jgi:hypothetical protein
MSDAGRRESVQIGRVLPLDHRSALDLLRDLARDRAVLADLRRLWARESAATTLCFTNDEQVLSQLAQRVASGSLVVASVRPAPLMAAPPIEDEAAGAAAAAAAEEKKQQPAEEKSWIEISVINAGTGAPVSGVSLLITPASGSEAAHKTDDKGKVRLDKITAGPCVVRCAMGDPARADVLVFQGAGSGEPPAPEAGAGGAKQAKQGGAPVILSVELHKVRTGETPESVAKAIGSTWPKIAKFNFGTDDPKKVERLLRSQLGCSQRAPDGKGYVFDDSDDPGILLLPREWKAEGMETGGAYTIEVRTFVDARTWIFSM